MNRSKKLLSLLAVLIILIGVTVLITKLSVEEDVAGENSISIFTLDADNVTELSWTYGEETISVVCLDETWSYADDSEFPLDSTNIEIMLSALSNIAAGKTIESPEDLEQYGLKNPACTIAVTADSTTEILIGDETSMGGERYLSIGDGNVYLVDSGMLNYFSYGLYDLIEKETIPTMTEIEEFSIDTDAKSFVLTYLENSGLAYSDSYVWFLRDGNDYQTLDTELTDSLTETVTGLTWGICVTYQADEDTLADYGLDDPVATVTVDYIETQKVATDNTDDNGNIVYEEKKSDERFVLEIGDYSDNTCDYCYARIAGSEMVYLIDASVADALRYADPENLRPDEVLVMDWTDVTAVDITLDGESCHAEKTTRTIDNENGTSTEETVYLLEDEETVLSKETVLENLTGMTSMGYCDLDPSDREEEVRFVFYRDTENFSEVELRFYRYDSNTCIVSLNGETTVFVSRNDVESIIETITKITTNK